MEDLTDGRVVYLVLLGCVVLVSVFQMYRNRMGQAMQHAMIWVLIFVGVILAVGFKDQLTAVLNDEPQQIDGETVALKRGDGGHFFATAEVNGSTIRFLVDTGATNLVLSRDDAERIGIETGSLDYILRSQTANGEVRGAPVRIDEIRLGDFTDNNVRAVVNGGELGISLLGMSYLDLYRAFRVEGDTMLLIR
jgi:aspartyl protease family protein